ncbi:MAG: YbaB/EbfC family nucleoid-associated protein, partial [Candidatus Methylomirabilales bacterium]
MDMKRMDMNKMLKEVAKVQAELSRAQAEIAEATVEGIAGGGAVKISLVGGDEVTEVIIDPSAIDPDDPSLLE